MPTSPYIAPPDDAKINRLMLFSLQHSNVFINNGTSFSYSSFGLSIDFLEDMLFSILIIVSFLL